MKKTGGNTRQKSNANTEKKKKKSANIGEKNVGKRKKIWCKHQDKKLMQTLEKKNRAKEKKIF